MAAISKLREICGTGLITCSFCWVDYLANNGCSTSLPVTLSRDRIRFDVIYVRTVERKKSIYVFNDK